MLMTRMPHYIQINSKYAHHTAGATVQTPKELVMIRHPPCQVELEK